MSVCLSAGVLLMGSTVSASGFFQQGGQVGNLCAISVREQRTDLIGGTCHGYVMAIADVMSIQPVAGRRACVTGGSDQAEAAVARIIKGNPRLERMDGPTAVAIALSEAYPCK